MPEDTSPMLCEAAGKKKEEKEKEGKRAGGDGVGEEGEDALA